PPCQPARGPALRCEGAIRFGSADAVGNCGKGGGAAMLAIEDIEPGSNVVHKNTGLRYAVVDISDTEVLLSPESDATMQDLMVPLELFLSEFVEGERYSAPRSRGGRAGAPGAPPPPA